MHTGTYSQCSSHQPKRHSLLPCRDKQVLYFPGHFASNTYLHVDGLWDMTGPLICSSNTCGQATASRACTGFWAQTAEKENVGLLKTHNLTLLPVGTYTLLTIFLPKVHGKGGVAYHTLLFQHDVNKQSVSARQATCWSLQLWTAQPGALPEGPTFCLDLRYELPLPTHSAHEQYSPQKRTLSERVPLSSVFRPI